MARKNEREFIQGDDVSDEDFAALNGESAAEEDIVSDASTDVQDAPAVVSVPEQQTAAPIAPQGDTEPKMVDIRALQEARAEIRRRDEEIARTREEQIRIEERLNLLNEALTRGNKPQEAEPKVPSMEEEPLDHIQHRFGTVDGRFKTVEERLASFEKAAEDKRKADEAEAARQQVVYEADMVIAAAGQQYPDVGDALNFAANGVKQEIHRLLTEKGITGQDYLNRANQMWTNELTRLAQQCPRDPNQAAEFVRRNARYWGWAGPQQVQQGQQQQNTPAPVQQPTVQQRAEQQNRHMSLSGITGAEPPKKLTAVDLGKMSEKEFVALRKTVEGRKLLEEEFGGI